MVGLVLLTSTVPAAEIVWPQNRGAFFSTESIEVAVAGLAKGAAATLELQPQKPGATAVKVDVKGDGSTVTVVLPPLALAPNVYAVKLDGKDAGKLTVTTGVPRSTMLLSQTSTRPPDGGANFILGNAFSFGLLDPRGMPDTQPRGKRSPGLSAFEAAVAADLPTVVYMYWTGYVTHKPFGDEKSWAEPRMNEAMRLLSFHTAQRLRKYGPDVVSVGPIDEPGLAWGRTPAGGMASGFPNWDEQAWYEQRGWKYTQNIAGQSDADWMKYLTVRCAIIKENYARAKKDIKSVWPAATWSADLYAPYAILDGSDPLNQQVNDVPASHVFFDFFGGPLSATGQMYLEKAHDPAAHLAHAMNGQLIGTPGPPRPLYHVLMNSMLAAGLHSNWWLNTGAMTKEDLEAVNSPAERIGPLFREMAPKGHDVAVLWGFTEIGMREKEITARQSKKKPLPEEGDLKEAEINSNAYEVGGVYATQLLDVHQVLRRAGYPADVVHERLLPGGVLKNYKTLVIIGQTFELPAEVKQAVADFVKGGGAVVVDLSTKVKFDGAITMDADFGADAVRARSLLAELGAKAAKGKRDASVFETSDYLNRPHRQAVAAVKAALAKTLSRPVFVSHDVDLVAERHVGGDGSLLMVLNGHEKYPEMPEEMPYPRYNYATAQSTFMLQGIPQGAAVYSLEGLDWMKAGTVEKSAEPITAEFAAGEMKLYLVAPKRLDGFDLSAKAADGALRVEAALKGVKMPWPFTLIVAAADQRSLYRLYRATKADGTFAETLPLGGNVNSGPLTVRLESPVGGLSAEAKVEVAPKSAVATPITGDVRVMDLATVRRFLAAKPAVVVVTGNEDQRAVAQELAEKLAALGIKATVKPEAEALRKVSYPRVWDPYVRLYKAAGEEKPPQGEVKAEVTLATDAGGVVTAKTKDGKDVENWRAPNSLITIGGEGYLDWQGAHEFAYEAGCKLYVDAKGQLVVLKGELGDAKTTDEFRTRWAKPWSRLTSHGGGFQLPPQLPEAYTTDSDLILLGDSGSGLAVAALQASELLPQVADAKYPGPGKALVSFAWSPFAVEKDVILVGASDADGLRAGVRKLLEIAASK
jgi:hypothetical protein